MRRSRKQRPKGGLGQSAEQRDGINEELQQKLLDQLNAYGNKLLQDDEEEIRDTNRKDSRAVKGSNLKNSEKRTVSAGETKNTSSDGKAHPSKKRRAWEENLHIELANFNKSKKSNSNGDQVEIKETKGPHVVVFEDRAKRRKVHEASQAISGDSHVTSKGQLRELSHEVYQFGLSGFDFENKEKLEVQRAIKLGAKPPKNTHIPYKEFMKLQKQKKEEELKQREVDRKMGLNVKKKASERDRKRELILRKSGFWQDPTAKRTFLADGQIGRYKSGVQVLSRQDIQQIKRQKGKAKNRRTKRS